MDPRFQTQNSSPSPQNNPYYSPDTQPSPNKYPTLPHPQNPQYNHPPQGYPPQPQYNPQINPYNPAGGPAGYLPPAQYGNFQAVQNQGVNSESFLLQGKIRELEQGLNSCFVKCYQGWLILISISGAMSFFKGFVSLVTGGEDSDAWFRVFCVSLIYGLWSTIQSVFGILAITQKSLRKANVACWMMTIYLMPSLAVELLVVNWINSYVPPPNDDTSAIVYFFMYLALFIVSLHILVHICVNMTGAFRVRKILSERKQVEKKLKEIDGDSFNA